MVKTKYQELWGWQNILDESEHEYYGIYYEDDYESATEDVQNAYNDGKITKEQAEKLSYAMDLDIDFIIGN